MTGMCQEFRPQAGLLPLTIYLAAPRGFCAGVDRAIQIVELALAKYGAPVYVRHEIVHNRYVVERLEDQGRHLRRGVGRNPGCDAPRDLLGSRRAQDRCRPRQRGASSSISTPPARSSPKSISRPSAISGGLRRHSDRPCRPSGSDRHHGAIAGRRGHLIETDRRRGALHAEKPGRKLAYITQTTLSVDDTARHRGGAAGSAFRASPARARKTSATPPPTGRTR